MILNYYFQDFTLFMFYLCLKYTFRTYLFVYLLLYNFDVRVWSNKLNLNSHWTWFDQTLSFTGSTADPIIETLAGSWSIWFRRRMEGPTKWAQNLSPDFLVHTCDVSRSRQSFSKERREVLVDTSNSIYDMIYHVLLMI